MPDQGKVMTKWGKSVPGTTGTVILIIISVEGLLYGLLEKTGCTVKPTFLSRRPKGTLHLIPTDVREDEVCGEGSPCLWACGVGFFFALRRPTYMPLET